MNTLYRTLTKVSPILIADLKYTKLKLRQYAVMVVVAAADNLEFAQLRILYV